VNAAPARPGVRVCAGCGVIAPLSRAACVVCATPFPSPPLVASGEASGAVWGCVIEADVACRVCALRTPIHGLYVEGELTCERCENLQAFDVDQWKEALDVVHKVAATCAPRMQGGPAARIGADATTLEHTQSSLIIRGGNTTTMSLRVKASAGHPLCSACKTPIAAELDGRGNLRAWCVRCGDRAEYAVPPAARGQSEAIRGVIAPEQRTDRAQALVKRDAGSGLVALTCPNCGAGLQLAPGTDIVTCGHCRTSALVPRGALARPKGAPPVFTPFWVLFDRSYAVEAAAPDAPSFSAPAAPLVNTKRVMWFVGITTLAPIVLTLIIGTVIAIVVMTSSPTRTHHHPGHHGALDPPSIHNRVA
jgi:hypothetical protein